MSTPVAPYSITAARITEGPCWLIHDANDQIVAATFDEPLAYFVTEKLNHRCRRHTNPFTVNAAVASMLFAFRIYLEKEMKAPIVAQELEIGPLLGELCEWFGLDMGERAIALGPAILGYLDRLHQDDGDPSEEPTRAGPSEEPAGADQLVSEQIHGEGGLCLG